jgi:hypothetical protein
MLLPCCLYAIHAARFTLLACLAQRRFVILRSCAREWFRSGHSPVGACGLIRPVRMSQDSVYRKNRAFRSSYRLCGNQPFLLYLCLTLPALLCCQGTPADIVQTLHGRTIGGLILGHG